MDEKVDNFDLVSLPKLLTKSIQLSDFKEKLLTGPPIPTVSRYFQSTRILEISKDIEVKLTPLTFYCQTSILPPDLPNLDREKLLSGNPFLVVIEHENTNQILQSPTHY